MGKTQETRSTNSDIPVHAILAGIGALEREELAWLLATLHSTDFLTLLVDNAWRRLPSRSSGPARENVQTNVVRERMEKIANSQMSVECLRVELWARLREALNCEPHLPLSLRSARMAAADLAAATVDHFWSEVLREKQAAERRQEDLSSAASRLWQVTKDMIARHWVERPSFAEVVRFQAARLWLSATADRSGGGLHKEALEELARRLRDLPSDWAEGPLAEKVREAAERGDRAALSTLLTGGTLGALAITVDVAGFGAYILAAKISAILPLVSGPAAVSTLAVLSNPLFAALATVGVGVAATSYAKSAGRERLAASLAIILALKGLAKKNDGLACCLDAFKKAEFSGRSDPLARYASLREAVVHNLGEPFPPTPGSPPGLLGKALPVDPPADESRGEHSRQARDGDGMPELLMISAATVGEILYTAASVDPRVLTAVDFARAADVSDILSFVAQALEMQELPDGSRQGEYNRLSGYVAERVVAIELAARGHQVEFPDKANQPGFDLLVDGEPFQIKSVSGLSNLHEHFDKYPDIPVFANEELFDKVRESEFEWKDKVYTVDGFTQDYVHGLVDDALSAAESIANVKVPIFAGSAALARGMLGYFRGSYRLEELPLEVALGMASRGILSSAGAVAGKFGGYLLFGPAGAIVFANAGALLALSGRGELKRRLETVGAQQWLDDLARSADDCIRGLRARLWKKREVADAKLTYVGGKNSKEKLWVEQRLLDDRVFLAEATRALEVLADEKDPVVRARGCFEAVRLWAIHPAPVQRELSTLAELLGKRPGLIERTQRLATQAGEQAQEWLETFATFVRDTSRDESGAADVGSRTRGNEPERNDRAEAETLRSGPETECSRHVASAPRESKVCADVPAYVFTCAGCGRTTQMSHKCPEAILGERPTYDALAAIYRLFRCKICHARNPYVWSNDNRLLFDPKRLVTCMGCERPIPLPRLAAMPGTRRCVACA